MGHLETKKHILFVCTGNTCRSPMAAAVTNAQYGETYIAKSCGIMAASGSPMSAYAQSALAEHGISGDFTTHASQSVTEELLVWAHVVVPLTESHHSQLLFAFPEYADKFHTFPSDISDPYGGDLEEYRRCLGDICAGLEWLM